MKEKILELLRGSEEFISGQRLSEQFGVTRTSVWKAITGLREMGYEIEAVRNKGYRLKAEPDILSAARIVPFLHTKWAGHEIRVFDSIDSSNSEAKREAEDGAAQGRLVIAEEQTAGRGRRGRTWESQKGEGIFMTLLLKPDIEPGNASMLTLVMGMAVRDALEELTYMRAAIKWPNDIICDGKKVCGILTEMSAQMDYINYIVIGVGININNREFPAEVASVATSVYQQTGHGVCRAELVAEIMNRFEEYYEQYLPTQNLANLVELYNANLINRGRKVQVMDLRRNFTGMARGINENGELLVETENGTVCVSAGEVSVRGVYGYV